MHSDSSSVDATSRPATLLQSIAEVQAQLRRPKTIQQGIGQAHSVDGETIRFQPLHRPPFPLLRVFDDGQTSAQAIRVRKSPFVVGRLEGDLTIPLDSQISSQHAEIVWIEEAGRCGWWLRDLQTTNGTFVRASHVTLKPGQVLLMGGKRYRFHAGDVGANTDSSAAPEGPALMTSQWQSYSAADIKRRVPALVEITSDGDAARFLLTDSEHWIGCDPAQCSIVLDDAMVSPQHARAYRDARGRWCVDDALSLNGLWGQIDAIALGKGGFFQCGEQRFSIQIA